MCLSFSCADHISLRPRSFQVQRGRVFEAAGVHRHFQISQMLHTHNPGFQVRSLHFVLGSYDRSLFQMIIYQDIHSWCSVTSFLYRTVASSWHGNFKQINEWTNQEQHDVMFSKSPPYESTQDWTVFFLLSRKLMNIAFVEMNPFPMRQIQNRRSFHLEKVRLELTELEAIRQTFLRERETTQDGRSFVSDDEEDNWPHARHISPPRGGRARRCNSDVLQRDSCIFPEKVSELVSESELERSTFYTLRVKSHQTARTIQA